MFDEIEALVQEYSKSDCWNQDEERLRYILQTEKKITLADSGGFFLEFSLSPKLRHYDEAYRFLTSSDTPSHLEIHNLQVDTKKGLVKIQFSDRSE